MHFGDVIAELVSGTPHFLNQSCLMLHSQKHLTFGSFGSTFIAANQQLLQ